MSFLKDKKFGRVYFYKKKMQGPKSNQVIIFTGHFLYFSLEYILPNRASNDENIYFIDDLFYSCFFLTANEGLSCFKNKATWLCIWASV